MSANVFLPGVIQIPSSLEITAITKAYQAQVTVTFDDDVMANTYIPGQLVRLFIPFEYGMQQAHDLEVKILKRDGNTITLDLNTAQFDSFVVPDSGIMPATLSPAGSRNLAFSNDTNQISFQSLNNEGN